MTQLCFTDNLTALPYLFLHDLLLLCSFLAYYPLTIPYFLLFLPYLLKLLFFLYPLLFSTSLLLLALLTVSSHLHDSPSTLIEIPGSTCSAVLSIFYVEFIPDEGKPSISEKLCFMFMADDDHHKMVSNEVDFFNSSGIQSKQLVSNSQLSEDGRGQEDRAENLSVNSGEKAWSEPRRLEEEEERIDRTSFQCRKEGTRRPPEMLRRDGSARKEKEWKRTLACKLFEERMAYRLCEDRIVVDGAEEMDLLWEAYEAVAHKAEKQRKGKCEKKAAKEEEDGDFDEERISGKLCCLQALRFSAGKMNLGVGRPSLVKISMALKGMALFHPAGRRSRRA